AEGGFVRRTDGSAFAVGPTPAPSQLPAELVSALTQAARAGESPPSVAVAQSADDATLAQWTRNVQRPFTRMAPWRWDAASPDAFAAAPDLRRDLSNATTAEAAPVARLFRPGLMVAAAALVLTLGATLVEWAWLKFDVWRLSRSIAALAR